VYKRQRSWRKVSGKNGGFFDKETEYQYKTRGEEMLRRVIKNPGPLKELAVKITTNDKNMNLPHYWLSEADSIILCGKIDWLKYHQDTDSVEIIDFKTSRHEEGEDSLQLPIYNLLVNHCQNREVTAASYWYLDSSDELTPKKLPDLKEAEEKILKIAKRMKLQKSLEKFDCPNGEAGCRACRPFESILRGEAEFVGLDDFKADVYVLNKTLTSNEKDSIIL
jgi:hypothetical protein